MKTYDFTITVKNITDEDASLLCSMLKYIEHLGKVGHSTNIGLFVDGDGSSRAKFEFSQQFATLQGREHYLPHNLDVDGELIMFNSTQKVQDGEPIVLGRDDNIFARQGFETPEEYKDRLLHIRQCMDILYTEYKDDEQKLLQSEELFKQNHLKQLKEIREANSVLRNLKYKIQPDKSITHKMDLN